MAGPAVPDMEDSDVAEQVTDKIPLSQKSNKGKKGIKSDNPYGDSAYCKGTLDVLKRLGAGKKYVPK